MRNREWSDSTNAEKSLWLLRSLVWQAHSTYVYTYSKAHSTYVYVFGGSFCPRIKSWLYLRGSSLTGGSFAGSPADCKEKLRVQTLTLVYIDGWCCCKYTYKWCTMMAFAPWRTSVNKLSSQIASRRSSIVKSLTEVEYCQTWVLLRWNNCQARVLLRWNIVKHVTEVE